MSAPSPTMDEFDRKKPIGPADEAVSIADGELNDPDGAIEKKLVRKLDLHIIPIVMLLYLFSFLDRVNIGNARLYGMEEDLGLHGNMYQVAVSILFVTYIIFEIPSNLVLKKFTPRRYIAGITLLWGIIATCTGVVHSYGALIATRLLLGVVEAGLFPGLATYLTMFYSKSELSLRIGYLFVSAAIAGACGGLLAYAIGFLDGTSGMRAWRWILIIEGLPTIVMGAVVYFFFANSPETAWYLDDAERRFLLHRLSRDASMTRSAFEFHWKDVRRCFTDPKCWLFFIAQFGADTMLYGYSTFLPTIISGLGSWTTAEVQALTIPCYAVGAITYLVTARLSGRYAMRAAPAVFFCGVSVIGYGIMIADVPRGVHYFGCFLIATGLYVAVGLPLAWLPNNSPRFGKRTAATGAQLTFGNASGVMAPFLYPKAEGPRYIKGHAVSLAMVGFAGIAYSVLWVWYSKLNRDRREGKQDGRIVGMSEEEINEMGDESPRYVYTT